MKLNLSVPRTTYLFVGISWPLWRRSENSRILRQGRAELSPRVLILCRKPRRNGSLCEDKEPGRRVERTNYDVGCGCGYDCGNKDHCRHKARAWASGHRLRVTELRRAAPPRADTRHGLCVAGQRHAPRLIVVNIWRCSRLPYVVESGTGTHTPSNTTRSFRGKIYFLFNPFLDELWQVELGENTHDNGYMEIKSRKNDNDLPRNGVSCSLIFTTQQITFSI